MVARPDAFFWLFGTRVSLGDFAGLSVAVTQSVSSEIARHCLLLAEFALSVILIRWWLVTKSSVPVRCLSNVGVVVTRDDSQRMLDNAFARVWQVGGNPCRGPRLSACGDSQRRVRELVPAVPLV